MNKEELKNIVSEIVGNSDDSVFNQFIKKIASSIEGNQALKLNGIGHFQIKKEPLSRMERKMEGNIAEKEILLFLPLDESNEDNILSFKIDEQTTTLGEFNDSVFDVGINKPTIISNPEIVIPEEGDEAIDETLSNKINEFIESGEIIEGYELFKEIQLDSTPTLDDESRDSEEEVLDDIIGESGAEEFTDVKIDEEFVKDDNSVESDNEFNEVIDDDVYNIASSSVEAEITEDDVNTSEAEIIISEDEDRNDEETETKLEEELPKEIEEESIPELEEEPTEIEAEIGQEFKTDFNEESIESDLEANPFDELDEYIKDETKDEAQDIIDAEPDVVDEIIEESESDSPDTTISKSEDNEDKWYKNPILYIASFGFIVAIVVIFLFLPTTPSTTINDESTNTTDSGEQLGLADSVLSSDSTNTNSNLETIPDNQLAENKSFEEKNIVEKKSESIKKVTKPKTNTSTGLYREIKNDQTVTNQIYFDGNLYTVQSSSWKSNSIAEREAKKLKKRGFDAFIFKVYIPSKNGTWNRVRIGYFNTRKEAEEFLKKNKI